MADGAGSRELEEAAVRSLELAERRKSDSEDRAAALSVKFREKEAKVRQNDDDFDEIRVKMPPE